MAPVKLGTFNGPIKVPKFEIGIKKVILSILKMLFRSETEKNHFWAEFGSNCGRNWCILGLK
jgi:hypothetical protein